MALDCKDPCYFVTITYVINPGWYYVPPGHDHLALYKYHRESKFLNIQRFTRINQAILLHSDLQYA